MGATACLVGFPAIFLQIDPQAIIELDALLLQQDPLIFRPGTRADLPPGVDDPLPGYTFRTGSHCPTYPARAKGQVGPGVHTGRRREKTGNLAVAGDPARRDGTHHFPDPGLEDMQIGRGNEWTQRSSEIPGLNSSCFQYILDGLQFFLREVQVAQRSQVFFQLGDTAGPDQCRGDLRFAQHPGQGHLRKLLAAAQG